MRGMGATWVRTWEDGPDYLESIGGVAWGDGPNDPPPWWHRCSPQTRGRIDGDHVERCRCGAARHGMYGPWLYRNETRKARRKAQAEARLPRVQVVCRVCGQAYEAADGTVKAREKLCTDCWTDRFIAEHGR